VRLRLAKPIFPNNVGFWRVNGPGSVPTSLGFQWDTTELPAGGQLGDLHWDRCWDRDLAARALGARAFLAWYRERRTAEFTALT
jgi:hypothetical protein